MGSEQEERHPLISDEALGKIFERYEAVLKAKSELDDAKEDAKARREDLDVAQKTLLDAIGEANSAQKKLF